MESRGLAGAKGLQGVVLSRTRPPQMHRAMASEKAGELHRHLVQAKSQPILAHSVDRGAKKPCRLHIDGLGVNVGVRGVDKRDSLAHVCRLPPAGPSVWNK